MRDSHVWSVLKNACPMQVEQPTGFFLVRRALDCQSPFSRRAKDLNDGLNDVFYWNEFTYTHTHTPVGS